MPRIAIIDYGLGNLRSAIRGMEYAGAEVDVTSDPSSLDRADGLVLPGVGAFKNGMENIQTIKSAIFDFVNDNKPLLGICLGMQMLMTNSEEGQDENGPVNGLNLIEGDVKRFKFENQPEKLKIPHMGWNHITIDKESPFLRGIERSYVYFVHSYFVEPAQHTIATSDYGIQFAAIVSVNSIFGTQFHPEKSSYIGLKMLQNFVEMC
ncbi:MAG TPA: imidazole glycerol phosphate synthase subunit HisH [Candidatus Acidoferrales bacterium]|nr:imidazole glycerol phosphate synthase subunit HisH [Candidatus Acidoferrales bacterium]